MQKIAESVLPLLRKSEGEIRKRMTPEYGAVSVSLDSVHKLGGALLMIVRDGEVRSLLIVADSFRALPEGFEGHAERLPDGSAFMVCPLSSGNAAALRRHFPWTAPVSLLDRRTTIGCGDRLGLASRGHIRAARRFGVAPVLAQQSVRELSMTGRSFREVVDAASFMVFESDYRSGFGADGDHLKSFADIEGALAAGMPMITLDLSEVVNVAAGSMPAAGIDALFADLDPEVQARIIDEYGNRTFVVGPFGVTIDGPTARRCQVMYGAAIDFSAKVQGLIHSKCGNVGCDLEISIDESATPTLPAHHLFIVRELRLRGVEFSSVAPRFPGEFQKGVDYIGDPGEFEKQFRIHAAIAGAYGGYKLSIHSGSDKFRVYPIIGSVTEGRFHLKTAGTSWLVALRLLAECEPALYRKIHACALENFDRMRAFYHVSADPATIPLLDTVSDPDLPGLLDLPAVRQVLHIAYGPILQGALGKCVMTALLRHSEEYDAAIERHFERHLSLLVPGGVNQNV